MEEIRSGEYSIRKAREEEWEEAMELAWNTFLIFQTKEYSEEGIESFFEFVNDRDLKRHFLLGDYELYVALAKGRIVGLITRRNGGHISLLFVDQSFQRKGVGSALVGYLSEYLRKEEGLHYLTVDAAPSAAVFYRKAGFWDLAPLQHKQGITFIPMKKNL